MPTACTESTGTACALNGRLVAATATAATTAKSAIAWNSQKPASVATAAAESTVAAHGIANRPTSYISTTTAAETSTPGGMAKSTGRAASTSEAAIAAVASNTTTGHAAVGVWARAISARRATVSAATAAASAPATASTGGGRAATAAVGTAAARGATRIRVCTASGPAAGKTEQFAPIEPIGGIRASLAVIAAATTRFPAKCAASAENPRATCLCIGEEYAWIEPPASGVCVPAHARSTSATRGARPATTTHGDIAEQVDFGRCHIGISIDEEGPSGTHATTPGTVTK